MARHSSHILELARRGAEARVRERQTEARGLVEAFPHLRDSFDADELPIPFILRRGARRKAAVPAETATRRGRSMSAAQRKAVSERMKKYWAARRAGSKKR
jgi:hypothetical protein